MKLQLQPNENILHPNPFVEQEYNPIVITTRRVIYAPHGHKRREIDAAKITHSGKGFHQQFVMLMGVFLLIGLPFFFIGAYKYYTYKDKPTKPPAAVKGMPHKPVTYQDAKMYAHNHDQQVIGIVLLVFGAIFGVAAYLLYKRRLTAIVAGQGKALQIRVKDKPAQDKLLMMIGAAQTASQAMVQAAVPSKVQKGPPATAPPK